MHTHTHTRSLSPPFSLSHTHTQSLRKDAETQGSEMCSQLDPCTRGDSRAMWYYTVSEIRYKRTPQPAWAPLEALYHGSHPWWVPPEPYCPLWSLGKGPFTCSPGGIFTDKHSGFQSLHSLRVFNVSHPLTQPSELKDLKKWEPGTPCQEKQGSWWKSSTNKTKTFKNSFVLRFLKDIYSAALNMPANLDNSAVATGLEKVSFHSNPKEMQCQRMLKLPHNCTHLTR